MTPLILFAHGAGAGSAHPWMQAWAERLGALGRVETFDHAYIQAGKRLPPRVHTLVEPHRAALDAAREGHEGPVVLTGKSMGSRVGCHVAETADVAAVVCFGYPLRSPKGTVRDEALLALRVPILFVQGSRDPLCPLDLLADVRGRMEAPSTLHVVEGGDHSLQVRKRDLKARETTQEAVDAAALDAVAAFLGDVLA
jgi:uncharacterized protein